MCVCSMLVACSISCNLPLNKKQPGVYDLGLPNLLTSRLSGLRVVARRDPCHREWNDAMAAVRHAGLMPSVASFMVILMNQAPWLSGAFMRQKAEALTCFLKCVSADDDFFLEHSESIKLDHGISGETPEQDIFQLLMDMPSLFATGDIVPAKLSC